MNAYSYKKKKLNVFNIPATRLLFRLLMVLLLFSVSRWLIYLFNTDFFHHLTLGQALRLYFVGMRFDLVVIAYANIPLILFFCLPFKFIYNKVLQSFLSVYYVFVNSALIILNMVDVIYFRFIGKRMTAELFKWLGDPDINLWDIAGQVVADYWFMLLLMVLFVLVLVVVAKRTRLAPEQADGNSKWAFLQWVSLMVFSALTPVAARGGLQQKPVSIGTAIHYADSHNVPILLNAPFTIAKGSTPHALRALDYDGLEGIDFSPVHFSTQANRFCADSLTYKPNLVYIVLEGVGQEMIGYYNPDQRYPLTPFLDSLLNQSLTFDGRANGRRAIEALPSLLSGIPALMNVDIAASPYAGNRIDNLGLSLHQQGYHAEHANDPSKDLDDFKQPFAILLSSLSLEHPNSLALPKESYLWSKYEKNVFKTDYALRAFFMASTQKPWYDSTLFVITANHANAEHYLPEYSNVWGMYSIPLAFFMPSRIEPLRCEELAQQIDLNLSVLSALGINDTVFSFGRNLFDSLTRPYSIAYINHTYQFSDGRYLIQSDGNRTIGVFNIQSDRQLNDNLIDRIQCEDLAKIMKKIIQEYNNRFIYNKLYIDKEAYREQTKNTLYLEPRSGKVE